MYLVYVANCTEHYLDGTSKPDGLCVSTSKDKLKAHIRRDEKMGNENKYWRYDTPKGVLCDRETYDLIMKKMIRGVDIAMFKEEQSKTLKFY